MCQYYPYSSHAYYTYRNFNFFTRINKKLKKFFFLKAAIKKLRNKKDLNLKKKKNSINQYNHADLQYNYIQIRLI